MAQSSFFSPDPDEALESEQIQTLQRRKLADLLTHIALTNKFYQRQFAGVQFNALTDDLANLPFTTRPQIEKDQRENPPYGTNLTYPISQYCRFHQTSGSGGYPVRWLDTAGSWEWFGKCWGIILRTAGVKPGDRLLFPFSFGPFVGFWAAFESAAAMGLLCLAAGGMTTSARLRMLIDNAVNIVFCTPTYALRMAEVAAAEEIDLPASPVRALIVAGEPGGSIPAVRARIESAWGARIFDHNGMTEMGAVGFECQANPGGLHIIESQYIAEVVDPQSGKTIPDGQRGELVLTNLGRRGSPLIRYRTGDLVRLSHGRCACGSNFARLEGGILARVDDMFIVRGNNVFPTAVEAVVRQFPQITEFRAHVHQHANSTEMRLEIEPAAGADSTNELAQRVSHAIQTSLHFRADVTTVAPGTLPRFEMKARRFVREAGDKS